MRWRENDIRGMCIKPMMAAPASVAATIGADVAIWRAPYFLVMTACINVLVVSDVLLCDSKWRYGDDSTAK